MTKQYNVTNVIYGLHTRCTSVDNTTYTKLQNTNDQWFCQNCVAPCGICSGNIHNCDPAIECDRCKTWIHNSCAIVSNDEYKNIQATNCTWICPLCDETNLSTSYSSTSSGIEINNIFDTLRNNKETHTCSRHIYTSKITMVSININGLRGKKLELQAYLQTENPDIVALQETKINNSIATNELIPDTLGYDICTANDRTGNGGGTMLPGQNTP
ncbi:E3.1.11.2 [Mytilus edulis]|uniref:E3.1.11.2 n=1 Tax=Mytilus edulis TaxID=6550 RepID=A0A8S3T147_MYTED|nr:E3.1.11.2 [Mytilus edulis]